MSALILNIQEDLDSRREWINPGPVPTKGLQRVYNVPPEHAKTAFDVTFAKGTPLEQPADLWTPRVAHRTWLPSPDAVCQRLLVIYKAAIPFDS